MGPWLWAGAALAGVTLGGDTTPPVWAGTCGEVDKFEVLAIDLDKGLVAFKSVVHSVSDYEPGGSVDCDYAGMDALPTSGVELGLFDLRAKTVETFTVYALAEDAAQCTPHARSEEQLAAAKARFAAVGLDITKPPVAIVPTNEGVVLPKGAGTVTVSIRASPMLIDEESMAAQKYYELRVGSASLHRRDVAYQVIMAGSYDVAFTAAHAANGKAVLVEKHVMGSMRGGQVCHTFTPLLSLP